MVPYIFGISIGCGICFLALTVVVYWKVIDWNIILEGPTWDFNRSWASNLSVAGSVFSYAALFGATGMGTNIAPRMIFMVIAGLATGLALATPLIFSASKRILSALGRASSSSFAFLLASSMTCIAIAAQIALGGSIIWELHLEQPSLSLSTAVGLEIAAGVVLLMTIWYAILSASDVLKAAHLEATIASGTTQWTLL